MKGAAPPGQSPGVCFCLPPSRLPCFPSIDLPSGSYDICFPQKDFPASTFPLRWAYLCGIFKKVFVPHYQAPPYDGTRVCLGAETEPQTTG